VLESIWSGLTGEFIVVDEYTHASRFQSKELAISYAKELNAAGGNVFFCHFTMSGNRSSKNALESRCLVVDIDTPDMRHAVSVILPHLKILPTWVVQSGHGMHLWWVLREVLDVNTWMEYASRLKAYLSPYGIDPAVTADPARIMRHPGSVNTKPNREPVLVKCKRLNSYEVCIEDVDHWLPKSTSSLRNVVYNRSSRLAVKYVNNVLRHCAFMRHAVETNGASMQYQEWIYAVGVGRALNMEHEVSRGYKDYSEREVDRLANGLNGIPLCSTIRASGCCSCCKSRVLNPLCFRFIKEEN
jgi:hypothetical protein